MPVYDYDCASCGVRTEVIHGIEAPGPRFCPACGAEGTLRKAFAPPTVHFKGSGWAKKDRSTASRARSKPAADSADGGSGEGSTTKSAAEPGGDGKGGDGKGGDAKGGTDSSRADGGTSRSSGDRGTGKGAGAAPPEG